MELAISLEPIAREDSTTLILGTMPGRESLEKGQYYANERNHFWRIMFRLFDESYSTDYEQRKNLLMNHRIALWDVLESCRRSGSLDSRIREGTVNDLAGFMAQYFQIKHVYCNGKKAYSILQKQMGSFVVGRRPEALPSTSPANTIGLEKKVEAWRVVSSSKLK